jgi:hypothetical protein
MPKYGSSVAVGRLSRAAAFAGALLLGGAGAIAEEKAKPSDAGFPAKVTAVYDISWNGLALGQFSFSSSIKGGKYSLVGDASLSAVVFSWRGITKSSGTVAGGIPKPSTYAFTYDGTKSGRLDMAFDGDEITKVKANPPIGSSPGRVPVTRSHLQNVYDPLSAVMAVSSANGGKVDGSNPCKRRIPVFDGKQRFDLVFSYLRKERLEGAAAATAIVCRVKYVPIAGHKMNDETKFMASTNDIEIWMIAVPRANVYVPYVVNLPTLWGQAQMVSTSIQMDVPGRGRIALVN